MSDLPSNHNSIPSPQCALGTTPHLSIRKKAKEGREEKERGEGSGGKCPGRDVKKDVKNDEGVKRETER